VQNAERLVDAGCDVHREDDSILLDDITPYAERRAEAACVD
jgi:hypothetical protein